MAKPKLWKLNPMDFTKMTPARQEKIAQAPAKPMPSPRSYKPNQIASALHPKAQYLKVTKIVERGADVKSYYLEPDPQRGTESLAWFSAGQYLSVSLDVDGKKLTRPYSLASSPREALNGQYMLTVKRVGGGLASGYILDNWSVGTPVTVSEPLGVFTYETLRDAKTVIGVAGGSGITPFRSLARAIMDGDEDAELILLYGSRTLDDAIFQEEFRALEKACPRFKLVNVLSDEERDGCEHGFITAQLIQKYAPAGDYSIFLCGPQAMYRFVDKEIRSLGLRKKFIRHELFGEYFGPEKEADYPAQVAPSYQVTVRIAGTEQTITAPSGQSLLRSMEANGIAAPAHCRSGECGWCHSRLVSGQVYVPKEVDGRREADLIYGYIHPCCSFPLSDLVIEVPPVGR